MFDWNDDSLPRRWFLERCAASAFGLSILPFGQRWAVADAKPGENVSGLGKAKRVIFLKIGGGLTHIDTFDPKDGNGPGSPLKNKAGERFTEYVPEIAKVADKMCVIRSMTANIGTHREASYFMRTAFKPIGTTLHPMLGAWAQELFGRSHKILPSTVCVGRDANSGNGFLPPSMNPLPILDPEAGLQFLKPAGSVAQLQKQLATLNELDGEFTKRFPDRNVKAYSESYDDAIKLMGGQDGEAFDLTKEPGKVRDAYGLVVGRKGETTTQRTSFGQGCLLARRLVEAGVRFVEVDFGGWDFHKNLEQGLDELAPELDQGFPANGGYANRITVTELLKKQDYATGHFGKWHMGPVQKSGTYGIEEIGSGEEETNTNRHNDERGRDAQIYDAAVKFIERHKEGPFYVNVWGHIPHNPINPVDSLVKRWSDVQVKDGDFSPQMRAKFAAVRQGGGNVDDAMRRYLADIESLDDSVGRLLRRLDELGLRENTIVVFNSDQGADMTKAGQGGLRDNQMGYNGSMRGGKHTHWQGGQCVPWIVRWPGHVPAGRVDDKSIISGFDWLPTLCAITGTPINVNDFDGEDTSAAWLGKSAHERTKPLFWKASNPGGDAMIRVGQWKLRLPTRRADGEIELYNLTSDPAESKNVAAANPEIVQRLSRPLEAWKATLPKSYVKTADKQD